MKIKIWWPLLFVASILFACVLIFPSDLRLADLFNRAGKYDEAIEQYLGILRLDPLRAGVRLELSRLYVLNNEPEKAVQELEKIGPEFIDDEFFLLQIADIYSQLGDKNRTVATLARVVDLNPGNLFNKRKLADAYDWNLQPAKAKWLYNELLAENPRDVELLNKIVQINLNQKRFEASISYLTRLIDLEPQNSRFKILLADVYIELERKPQAAGELEKVLAAEPANDAVRQRLAELYLWQQDFYRGLEHYEYLVTAQPANEKYFEHYTGLAYNLAPDKAIHLYKQRLEQRPNDTELRERFAGLYLHVGDTDNAVRQAKTLVARNPDTPKYYKQLAYLYQDMREPHLANPLFEYLFKKELEDEEVVHELISYYYDNKEFDKLLDLYLELYDRDEIDEQLVADHADLLMVTKHYDEALQQYHKLSKVSPENVFYRIRLADLHRGERDDNAAIRVLLEGLKKYDLRDEEYLEYSAGFLGERHFTEESIAAYEKLVSVAPENHQYKKQLVAQYIRNRDFDQAIQLQNEILVRQPHDIPVRFELADLYWLQNDFDKMHTIIQGINTAYQKDFQINKKIGRFYFERGFYDQTIAYTKQALLSSPNDSTSLRMLGLAYAWNNQPRQSQKILTLYNTRYPNDYYTHFTIGELLLMTGDREKSAAEFQTALNLMAAERETKETRGNRGKIYAFQNRREKSSAEFESLLAEYPKDAAVHIDYAESMLNLKVYNEADDLLDRALALEPQNYRALRLQSRSHFEQGRYPFAANVLRRLLQKYPDDMGLRLDLADIDLADGDWYNSTHTLAGILKKYSRNSPAQTRLTRLRRIQNESLSAGYKTAKQGDNFFRQVYEVAVSKAKSSLLHLKALFGEETYSTGDNSLPEAKYQNAGVSLSSHFNKNLQTTVGAKGQGNGDNWYLAGTGKAQWNFNSSNSAGVSVDLNDLWRDPFAAAFRQGRLNRVQSDVNLSLKRIYLWNRFSYERYKIASRRYGAAMRSYLQVGYRWSNALDFSTYYQLYHLKYKYGAQADRNLVSIPEEDLVHYLGGNFTRQLSGNFYTELGGSVGYNSVRNSMTYFGTARLEYTLLNRLRFRSLLEYGSQNKLTGNGKNTSLLFDFSFFY